MTNGPGYFRFTADSLIDPHNVYIFNDFGRSKGRSLCSLLGSQGVSSGHFIERRPRPDLELINRLYLGLGLMPITMAVQKVL